MTDPNVIRTLPDAAATEALGRDLADALQALAPAIGAQGFSVHLKGELGAGKTTLARALLQRLGVTGPVKSPTYTLLEPYETSRLHLYHFDFYRFKNPREFPDGGFAEFFGPGAVCLVEWPERAGAYLPPPDLQIALQDQATGRSAMVSASSEIGGKCRERMFSHR